MKGCYIISVENRATVCNAPFTIVLIVFIHICLINDILNKYVFNYIMSVYNHTRTFLDSCVIR